jgi:hypothetical protein
VPYANRAEAYTMMGMAQKAWDDVKTCTSLGGNLEDHVIEALRKLG